MYLQKFLCVVLLVANFSKVNAQKDQINFITVVNKEGPLLGYSQLSGVTILTIKGNYFKDLNKNEKLDRYEDWRLSNDDRAKDLASKLSIEQIAGLMLYSPLQSVPVNNNSFWPGTYNGLSIDSSGLEPYSISDQQRKFLKDDNLRHMLVASVKSPQIAAKWNNEIQSFVEGLGMGIPANNSSDPRNAVVSNAEYNLGAGGKISMWPESIGLAATFDPTIVFQFGQIAAKEYRALGIATALSPQIDLATEPRWNRFNGTFGESPDLSTDMAKAYIDGFQTSNGNSELNNGWGYNSVNTMVKHWPSGGPEEGGRDAHFAYGKFAVYPGNNFEMHLKPFTEGALKLDGKTKKASAVMPYYTIAYNQDSKNGENVGNSFSKYIITDLLRNKYNYDGVVCSDWRITSNEGKTPNIFAGKSWGVEKLTVAERHYKIMMSGVDQFGGNSASAPVLEAYKIGVKEYGEVFMRNRLEQSAIRLLRNIFQVGLFENPYLDSDKSSELVGNPEFMKAGFNAQLKSIVLLKNKQNILPISKNKTIYIPKRFEAASKDWFGNYIPEKNEYPVSLEVVKKYFNITDDPNKADIAIVFVKGPNSGVGYNIEDRLLGGNGYVPISLQYGSYTASFAREQSIGAGDPVIDPSITNRSYKGKTTISNNVTDLKSIVETKELMRGKPVVVCMSLSNPAIVSEFESAINGLIVSFGVQDQALMEIISGSIEPSGLLPLQMPNDMKTVELQLEDVPFDMNCYKDSEGNVYDFAFGLNWKGVINDNRTKKYNYKKK